MKKILYSALLAVALISKAIASPEELHTALLSREETTLETDGFTTTRTSEMSLHDEKGYIVDIKATNHRKIGSKKVEKTLEFRIHDKETEITLIDRGANGVSKGDSLLFNHRFANNDCLEVTLECKGNNNFKIANRIYNGTNDLYRPEPVDMSKMNFFVDLYLYWRISPIIKWGQNSYSNLVEGIEKQIPLNLQYCELKDAIKDFEAIEPRIVNAKDEKTIFSLCGKYFDSVKGRMLKDSDKLD